jgi:transcriptional regulator with XRE-family HTH domain
MRIRKQLFCILIALFACSGVDRASSTEACKGNNDALGVSRVIAVEPTEHSRIGTMQYEETLPLADHEVVITFDDGPSPKYTSQAELGAKSNVSRNTIEAIENARAPEAARASLIASFASGVVRDEVAVRAAITSSWSNGQTEGQITRLKLVRRQMYGRGKIDLLQARLIGAE